MRKIVFLLIIFYNQISFGQVVQTYNGAFGDGNAVYQYYENNLNRFYHGNFTFTNKYETVKGTFNNNLKIGKWQYSYKNVLKETEILENITGNFDNGNMNGEWKHSYKKIVNGKIIESKNSIANFLDNNFIGKFSVNISIPNYILSINGQFNEFGFLDSVWNFKIKKDGILRTYTSIRRKVKKSS